MTDIALLTMEKIRLRNALTTPKKATMAESQTVIVC